MFRYSVVSEHTLVFICTQVHGVTNDTITFVKNIINTEINSATDNPVSFPEKTRLLLKSRTWCFHHITFQALQKIVHWILLEINVFFLMADQDGICRKR